MNAKSAVVVILLGSGLLVGISIGLQRKERAVLAAESQRQSDEIVRLKTQAAQLKEQLALTEKQLDRLKTEAAEVYKLRGEVSNLRKANADLEKRNAEIAQSPAPSAPEPSNAHGPPASFASYSEAGQYIGNLRAKMSAGASPTPEELAWLNNLKPDLEKLESSPQDFAAFQAAMIQKVAGVTDPQKIDQIQKTIQKVYENAGSRGLTVDLRPAGDPAWVEQRHQLDRRGTGAVQRILDDNERAAFDRAFLGIMGVDLGTGVDKTLYPPGFLRD